MKVLEKIFINIMGVFAVAVLILISPILLALAILKTLWSFCKGGFERLEKEQRNL